MLPTILPRSVLHVRLATESTISDGDVVCVPNGSGMVVAHRVIHTFEDGGATGFTIRGDAQSYEEKVPSTAVAYVVTRVEHPLLSYETDSNVGRFLSNVALRHHGLTLRIGKQLRRLHRAISKARALCG